MHTNLVANDNLSVLLKEHLLDSMQLLPWLKPSRSSQLKLVDIGSGAGFPALVLAICRPDLQVTLLESIGKKCRFLEEAAEELGLDKRVRVICQRAESTAHESRFRERFDFATARAVGSLPMVAELCLPFLKTGGLFLAQRSKRQANEEADYADDYASRLGGHLKEIVNFKPDLLGRELSLLVMEKLKTTPLRYPRTAAEMKKGLK